MITRKLGSLLRGKATPFQIVAASVLGALLGFAPALGQAPGLYLLLVGALAVVNANLGLALLVAALTRVLALVAAPLSYHLGRFLLDGPLSGVAHAAVNAPVLAWCGLQYYAVAGGLVNGAALGLLVGFLVANGIKRFRRRMVKAAENPSRWRELASRRWAKITIWLFFGGAGKGTWEEKLGHRVGNPIRIWGAVLVVVAGGGLFLGHRWFAGPLVQRGMKAGLEQANGATVDVGGVDVDLGEGRFGVRALALADPDALDRDLFRAAALEADFDQVDFLRRRVHIAKIVISEAASGLPREQAGERVAPAAAEVYDRASESLPSLEDLEDLTLEDVLAEAELWQARLAQTRRWIDRLSGPAGGESGTEREGLSERLAREVREKGWLRVEAAHLVDEAPTFRLSDLSVEGLKLAWLPGRVFDLRASEISTHPWLVDAPPKLELASRDGSIRFGLDLAPVSRGGGDGGLSVSWKGIAVDDVMSRLRLPGRAPLAGGTLDLSLGGSWAGGRIGWIDVPLVATFHDTTLSMKGIEPTKLARLEVPIGLSGPLDSPRVRFDGSKFADALAAAGKSELAKKVRGELEGAVGEKLDELSKKAGVELPGDLGTKVKDDAKGLLEGVLGGGKKKDEKKKGDG